jgi:GNAT superfamily N-acetyltransferase
VGVAVRPAVPADAPVLARLRYAFRAELDAGAEAEASFLRRCERWIADRLSGAGAWRCWVAEDGQSLVGMVWLQIIEKLPNPVGESECHGYVSSFYVVPSHRSAGLGSALLTTCLGECENRGTDAVFLWPTPRSRPLYERHGFLVRDDFLERRLHPAPRHAGLPADRIIARGSE